MSVITFKAKCSKRMRNVNIFHAKCGTFFIRKKQLTVFASFKKIT